MKTGDQIAVTVAGRYTYLGIPSPGYVDVKWEFPGGTGYFTITRMVWNGILAMAEKQKQKKSDA